MLDSRGGAFADELDKSDNFIPASIFEEEVPAAKAATLGPLSSKEIERMVQKLVEPGTIEIRNTQSTVSSRVDLVHSKHAPDIEAEEMGEDWEVPDRESGEEEDVEVSKTDSVDNTQLNKPFSSEDLVSQVTKSNLNTFTRFNFLRLSTTRPRTSQRQHLPFTNPAINPKEDVVVSIPIL
uniref:Uncharacterized protein n=1 Tax=Cannabis sativa TaxID=3483 RepID=A0A803PBM8_CANSA